MLFEFPKFVNISEAKEASASIIDALLTMQYSGRNEGRNNSARRKHRIQMNTFAEEFVARCNVYAKRAPDQDEKQEWHDLRNDMVNQVASLQSSKEKIQDMMSSVW